MMKTILILLVLVSPAVDQQAPLQKGRQVLLDFRKERHTPPPKISAATERMVLSKMFRRYLKDQNQCNQNFNAGNNSDHLAAARKAGEIVPSIFDMATGSFTAAGQQQTLYLVSVSECNASHADAFGTKRVAIFSGQQLVADLDVNFKNNIALKTDLNSDGIDELLLTSTDQHQGTIEEMATLVMFQNRLVQEIHDFGLVLEDSCANLMPGSASKASVLYTTAGAPGTMPNFTVENYQAGCNRAKRWRLISRGKMQ
ncbi:MAG TPA: hypothetical protein VJM50_09495 [Pyrinomonadaceae bacterium]|nr:hypothetical protein [Pyrinomonadaceae bacterium]